jgi:hypothetical protein
LSLFFLLRRDVTVGDIISSKSSTRSGLDLPLECGAQGAKKDKPVPTAWDFGVARLPRFFSFFFGDDGSTCVDLVKNFFVGEDGSSTGFISVGLFFGDSGDSLSVSLR